MVHFVHVIKGHAQINMAGLAIKLCHRVLNHLGHLGEIDLPCDESVQCSLLGGVEHRSHQSARPHDLAGQPQGGPARVVGG